MPLVIKTDILKRNKRQIDEHCFYVDVEYILYPVPYVNSVIYYDIFVYMYRIAQAAQSVSMAGFRKHIQNHIDVILHVLDYINEYKKQPDCDEIKVKYMSDRIAQMTHDQVDIFTSFPLSDKSIQRRFKEFDRAVKEKKPVCLRKIRRVQWDAPAAQKDRVPVLCADREAEQDEKWDAGNRDLNLALLEKE